MNPLPRLLAFGLFVVLAMLAVVLSGPVWRHAPADGAPPAVTAATPPHAHPAPSASRLAEFSQRAAFPLALTALALATALVASLALRSSRGAESRPPFNLARTEADALTKLAASSAAQGAALATERRQRELAEADALLNQQRLNRSLEEKIRLGRDLHDGIIQSLYAAGLTIESARSVAATDPADADRRLEQTRQNLNHAIREIRTYIAGLSPETVRQTSFATGLQLHLTELSAATRVQFDLKIDDHATTLLTPDQSTEALQIAREAVSNALRHGAATHLTIRLHSLDDAVCLLVLDNGSGFVATAATEPAGRGLANMRARAEHLGGNLRVESAPTSGTRVVLTLPVRT